MVSTLAAPKSPSVSHFIGKNYEVALNQSIEAVSTSLGNPNSGNLSSFISDFRALLHSKADPPLETTWIFAALTFTNHPTTVIEPLDRILAIKDLFQLIVSCSASCDSAKSIALVAPIIYNLHNFILEFRGLQIGPKKEKKVKSEIGSLVDSVVGYVNVCCDGFEGNFDDSEDLVRPLGDLISFWIIDNGVRNKNEESLRLFFPLLSDNCVARVSVEGRSMVDLAGFVVTEAFLLKLCWKIQEGFGEKMQNELKYWIVGSITGFRNSYFYVSLASLLLEPVLPTTSIMNTEHGEGLRKILFDALLLAEYSFLSPDLLDQLPAKHAKRVNFIRLMVADEAINFLREHGGTTETVSYLNAFSISSLPAQIIKLVRSEIGNEFGASEPNGLSPRAFLRWILNIENRGIKIFEDDMSGYRAKLMSTDMQEEEMGQLANRGGKNTDSDLLFYIDNKGQEENGNGKDEEDTSKGMSAAFMAAAHSMESSELGGRKRKSKKGEKTKKVKFVKYGVFDDSSLPGERSAASRNKEDSKDIENRDSSDDE